MKTQFFELKAGDKFLRTDSFGETNLCLKLRTLVGEWNTVYLDGAFSGGFCATNEESKVILAE